MGQMKNSKLNNIQPCPQEDWYLVGSRTTYANEYVLFSVIEVKVCAIVLDCK